MLSRSLLVAIASVLAGSPALAQRAEVGSLRRALSIWSSADLDHDGRITTREAATSISVDAARFAKADADGDGSWSREEFLLFYRQCVVTSAERAGTDLDAEIVRLQALRTARAVEEARQRVCERPAGKLDPSIASAFVQLDRGLCERRATLGDVARVRQLLRAKSAPAPIGPIGEMPGPAQKRSLAPAADADAILDRIERAIEHGQDAPAERANLRELLGRRGWIAVPLSQSRLMQRGPPTGRTRSP